MSAWQDAPDLGAYTAQADSDEEVLAELEREVEAVSYTHLTLPTICSV